MSADDGPVANREVAWRLFAAEFRDADMEYSEADEERAPNYVITPTGARVNRLFVVGVLTEVEQVGDDILRARVVDPTGAFVVYAGQYQPDAKAFLQGVTPPAFVAVTGKARTFEPDDSDVVYTSIRPESINVVDADTRDRWAVQTARHTLYRVSTFDDALALDEVGGALEEALLARGVEPGLSAGIGLARDHYGTTRGYLSAVHDLSLDAARVVAGEIDADAVGSLSIDPDEGDADPSIDLSYSLPEAVGDVQIEPSAGMSEPATTGETAAASTESTTETPSTEDEPVEAESVGDGRDSETGIEAESEPDTETGVEAETADSQPEQETTDESIEPEPDDSGSEPTEVEPTDVEAEVEADAEAESEADEATSEMYELDEEERQEIEENYPTDFSSGAEVGEPGEADIEPEAGGEFGEDAGTEGGADAGVEPETETEAETEGEAEAEVEAETTDESSADDSEETEPAASEETEETPEDIDDALMEVMTDLNEGGGVSRADLESEMADRHGVSPAEVGEAIDSALMGGQCYESGDDTYMPI